MWLYVAYANTKYSYQPAKSYSRIRDFALLRYILQSDKGLYFIVLYSTVESGTLLYFVIFYSRIRVFALPLYNLQLDQGL